MSVTFEIIPLFGKTPQRIGFKTNIEQKNLISLRIQCISEMEL